jgi:hypothetical protein
VLVAGEIIRRDRAETEAKRSGKTDKAEEATETEKEKEK